MSIKYCWCLICCLIITGCGTRTGKLKQNTTEEARKVFQSVDDSVTLDKYPEMINEVQPVYPLLAVNSGLEGTVWVRALISEGGDILEAVIEKSSGFTSFDEAALKAARKCKYNPGIQQGIPVSCWVSYKVEFNLKK